MWQGTAQYMQVLQAIYLLEIKVPKRQRENDSIAAYLLERLEEKTG
jgi:hypothetical protein